MNYTFDPVRISIEFLVLSVILATFTLFRIKPDKKSIRSGLVSAVCIAATDFVIESSADRLALWHLHGALPLLGVPLVFTAAWVFNGLAFCVLWGYRIKQGGNKKILYVIFALSGAVIGTAWNWLGSTYLGVLTFELGNLFHAFLVWLFLTPFAIAIYEKFSTSVDKIPVHKT
jgi:uncharacterized membrane protein